jgi:hypothetical protein
LTLVAAVLKDCGKSWDLSENLFTDVIGDGKSIKKNSYLINKSILSMSSMLYSVYHSMLWLYLTTKQMARYLWSFLFWLLIYLSIDCVSWMLSTDFDFCVSFVTLRGVAWSLILNWVINWFFYNFSSEFSENDCRLTRQWPVLMRDIHVWKELLSFQPNSFS